MGRSESTPQLGVGGQRYLNAWQRGVADARFVHAAIRLPPHLIDLLASAHGEPRSKKGAKEATADAPTDDRLSADRRLQLLAIPTVRRQYLSLIDTHGGPSPVGRAANQDYQHAVLRQVRYAAAPNAQQPTSAVPAASGMCCA